MTSRWHWIVVVTSTTALDLMARFGAGFDFARVMHTEAVLFPGTALALAAFLRYEPPTLGWSRRIRVGLTWLFGLGGLRPLLWSLGVPLMFANLVALLGGLIGMLVWVLRRRHAAENARVRATAEGD